MDETVEGEEPRGGKKNKKKWGKKVWGGQEAGEDSVRNIQEWMNTSGQ